MVRASTSGLKVLIATIVCCGAIIEVFTNAAVGGLQMSKRYIWHRVKSRTKAQWRYAQCLVAGHQYGQHFNEIFQGGYPEEHPWCARCGREEP